MTLSHSNPARADERSEPTPTTTPIDFAALGLVPELLRAVADAGYRRPTRIQQLAIPPVLKGRDVIGCAQTGTGKSAAFTLPALQHLDRVAGDDPVVRVLVLTPTRELAAQIGESFATYGRHLDLLHAVIFGGVSDRPQIKRLRSGVDALVATPGRLLDLMERGEIDLRGIELFVLDEADRMLDMGFLPAVKRVVRALPKQRQTLLFSATMPPAIRALASELLHDPAEINAAPAATPGDKIDQRIYFVDKRAKQDLLVDLLDAATGAAPAAKTLIFSRTKHGANRIVKKLARARISAAAIHGNKSQNARVRALEDFRDGRCNVLVATDIASRGIDVEGITHVVNFDLPNEPETYVHRIGRTARAGASGLALSMCDDEERAYLIDIERLIGRHIDRVDDHDHPPTEPPPPPTRLEGPKQGTHKPRKQGGGRPRSGGRNGRSSGGNAPRNGGRNGRRSGPRNGGRRSGPRG